MMPGRRRSRESEKMKPTEDNGARDSQGLPHGVHREPSTIRTQPSVLLDCFFRGKVVKLIVFNVFRGMPAFRAEFSKPGQDNREVYGECKPSLRRLALGGVWFWRWVVWKGDQSGPLHASRPRLRLIHGFLSASAAW